ncbi:hypothetical protein WICPIJ_005728 [Wickerhamomyces pijperi]|uniref:Uncharacterized protein n=1 Tax=Wickerhamomyces pijperi TaxID=599730 RepID=A0A9P8Q317_WICPI|nr:hypothetical protein WICPIJ_005728 [Wickerhamomyces pijperi]
MVSNLTPSIKDLTNGFSFFGKGPNNTTAEADGTNSLKGTNFEGSVRISSNGSVKFSTITEEGFKSLESMAEQYSLMIIEASNLAVECWALRGLVKSGEIDAKVESFKYDNISPKATQQAILVL